MNRIICAASLLLLAVHVGAPLAEPAASVVRLSEPVERTADSETFGVPFDNATKTVSLSKIIADGDAFAGKVIRTNARVSQVCQKKGCFFIAAMGTETIRISFVDYSFFVPTDISGRDVELIGEVVERELTQEEVDHYALDIGSDAEPAKPGKTYEIVATSVRVPRT